MRSDEKNSDISTSGKNQDHSLTDQKIHKDFNDEKQEDAGISSLQWDRHSKLPP